MTNPYFAETSKGKDEKWLLNEKYGGRKTAKYEADRGRLACGEPVAYVIGWQPFLGLKIHLDSRPLIPRPETEWWTEQLLKEVASRMRKVRPTEGRKPEDFSHSAGGSRFLDLCAGSGAIGCAALKSLPYTEVSFGEIDATHKAVILKNIRENGLDESRAKICIGNLFKPFGNLKFDVIAVNPPYIPIDRLLPASVVDYEPSLALFAGKDGLDIIRRIASDLPKHLSPDGFAWVECDGSYATVACGLFTAQGLITSIRNDQYGKPSVVVVTRKKYARIRTMGSP